MSDEWWRGYVVVDDTQAMRVGKKYKSKGRAIKSVKEKTEDHMGMNFPDMDSDYEYGAYKVPKKGNKYPKGKKGNTELLDDHRESKGQSDLIW